MNIRKQSWLLVVFVLAGLGCDSAQNVPDEPPAESKQSAVDPWEELQASGDVDVAEGVFKQWRDGQGRPEGTVGLMVVSKIRGDSEALRRLLAEVGTDELDDEHLVKASDAGLDLRPVPSRAIELGKRACEVATTTDDKLLAHKAQDTCAMATAAASAQGALDVCKAGCDETIEHSLFFAGSAPVVMASVNGSEPTPFIVDTGASGTVVTAEFARENGITAVPGTKFDVNSPGGLLETELALTSIETAGLRIDNTPTMILELPIKSIGGIISPQASWRDQAVEFDFRDLALVTAPKIDTSELTKLPLTMTERTPYVRPETEGRRAAPLLLDTGASQTVLFASWEALGNQRLERVGETRVAGAGGKGAKSWQTNARLEAHVGEFALTIEDPTLADRKGDDYHQEVRYYGLLGMDMLMGRRLILDTPSAALWLSAEPKMSPWKVGEQTVYEVKLAGRDKPILVTEKVTARDGDDVTLEVSYDRDGTSYHFGYVISDTWANRGTWLISRPVEKMWDITEDGKREVAAKKQAQRWLPIFTGFQPKPTQNPQMRFVMTSVDGTRVSCTEIQVPAAASDVPEATLEIVECPTLPWRTQRLTLKGPDGEIIYQFEQRH